MNFKLFAITILSIISIGNAIYPYSFYPTPLHPSLHPSLHPPLHPKSSSLAIENFDGARTSGSFTITPLSSYCQIRLDFTSFNVGSTDVNGDCFLGALIISGQENYDVPVICGQNTGQHLYLNFYENNPITLTVVTDDAADYWNLKITQISCSDTPNLAPEGCLQYYQTQTGTVQSFNYRNNVNTYSDGTDVTYQPANMNYLVCLGPSDTLFSTITWTKPFGASNFFFTISDLVSLEGNRNDSTGSVVDTDYDSNCITDYVTIPNGVSTAYNGTTLTAQRYCGLGFPASVTSTFKRFTLGVVFDSTEPPLDDGNIGFFLQYTLS